jgi:hypothetical protein
MRYNACLASVSQRIAYKGNNMKSEYTVKGALSADANGDTILSCVEVNLPTDRKLNDVQQSQFIKVYNQLDAEIDRRFCISVFFHHPLTITRRKEAMEEYFKIEGLLDTLGFTNRSKNFVMGQVYYFGEYAVLCIDEKPFLSQYYYDADTHTIRDVDTGNRYGVYHVFDVLWEEADTPMKRHNLAHYIACTNDPLE